MVKIQKRTKYVFLGISVLLMILCGLLTGSLQAGKESGTGSWTEVLNLDFEEPALAPWQVGGAGYNVGLDTGAAAKGKQSLVFRYEKPALDGAYGFVSSQLPIEKCRGKRVRLTGMLKVGEACQFLSLFIRANKGIDPTAYIRQPPRGPKVTQEFTSHSVELDIPMEADSLRFGVVMSGEGMGWADDLSIEILPARGEQEIELSGVVVDKAGQPVAGALTAIKTIFHETALAVSPSDEKGRFSYSLLPGIYFINVSAPGLTSGSLPVRMFRESAKDLKIVLGEEGFLLEGKIHVPGGKIPGNSYVTFLELDFFDINKVYYLTPRQDGGFKIKLPKGKSYKVSLDAPGFKAVSQLITPDWTGPCVLEVRAPKPAPAAVVDWIKSNALALKTAEPGQGYEDLWALKKSIGNSRVVALGESTHGTREIFRMKHRFLEFLVQEMGFTVFAMESPWPEALVINDYVLHGKGDPAKALSELYLVWDTEEVLSLIEWMRSYNADPAHKQKVKFYGIDVQGSMGAVKYLVSYLKKTAPAWAQKYDQLFAFFENTSSGGRIFSYSQKDYDGIKKELASLLEHFDQDKALMSDKTSVEHWGLARRHVYFLDFFMNYIKAGKENDYDSINVRGRGMAHNVQWIMDREKGAKIMLWAHNFHISAASYPGFPYKFLGMHLKEKLGKDYFPVGFVFNRGAFHGVDFTSPTRTPFTHKNFSVEPIKGSYGAAFSRTGLPIFWLDLVSLPGEGEVGDWFAAPHVFKWVNSAYIGKKDIQYLYNVKDLFDAVIFLEQTTASRINQSRRRLIFPN